MRAELDRILASDIFTRSERLSAYLRFIVERTLAGEGDTLKEQVLAIGLYGKTADFNTAADPIVRVDARRLRDRLREYYASAPPGDLVISVPKGSYTPAFTTTTAPAKPADHVAATARRTKSWTVATPTAITTIALAAACVAGAFLYRRSREPTPLLANVVIDLPAGWSILNQPPAISPDSRHIAFSAVNPDGQRAIWLRSLDEGAARLLANTAHGVEPFWSPDGSAVGFFAEGKLKVLDVAGGTARNLCDAPNDSSGTWSASGLMLFAPGQDGTVSAVRAVDGAVRPVSRLDQAAGDLRHSRPQWLQDGRHFVYLADRRDGQTAMLASIDGPSTQPLGPVQSHVQPTRTQHVLYVRDGNLLAQRLDVQAGRLTGETTILAEGLAVPGRSFGGRFSASADLLVYLKSPQLRSTATTVLTLFDRSGRSLRTLGEPGQYFGPSMSPDGTRVAVSRGVQPRRDLWIFDLTSDVRAQLTLDPGDDVGPKWSTDGRWILFSSDRRGVRDIYRRPASGEGSDELVFASDVSKSVSAWSPDGRYAVYDTGGLGRGSDLHAVPLAGDRRPQVLAAEPGFQQQADFSPDGRLIAYASSESGRYEIIVATFPDKASHWKITTDGGREPIWRGDGRELYFLSGQTVMAVDIHRDRGGLEWGAPRPLFQIPNLFTVSRVLTASRDGQQFLAVTDVAPNPPQSLSTLLNWASLLK